MLERRVLSRTLLILAAVAAVATAVAGYARYGLLDSGQFSDRAVQSLRDQDVRDLIGREVTDRVVLAADPDLVAARPIIQSLVGGIAGTDAFRSVFRSALSRVHTTLVTGRQGRLQLDLADASVLVRSALERVQPKLAAKLPTETLSLPIKDSTIRRVGTLARDLRRLPWILGGLALLLGAAGGGAGARTTRGAAGPRPLDGGRGGARARRARRDQGHRQPPLPRPDRARRPVRRLGIVSWARSRRCCWPSPAPGSPSSWPPPPAARSPGSRRWWTASARCSSPGPPTAAGSSCGRPGSSSPECSPSWTPWAPCRSSPPWPACCSSTPGWESCWPCCTAAWMRWTARRARR